jgi:DNA-binding NarL/FixJ family response regulator
MVHLLIEETSDLTLLGMRIVLEADRRFQVLETVRGLEALLTEAARQQPEVIIAGSTFYSVDILTAVENILTTVPSTRLMLMGGVTDGRFIHDLLLAGVRAYLCKHDDLSSILSLAISVVMRDKLYLSPSANSEYLSAMQYLNKHWPIHKEARAVLQLLVQGQHMMAIAQQLALPLRRVYWLRHKLRERFNATTNEQLILRAITEGFVVPLE